MYTTSVVCLVSGMWGSMVCGVEVGGMWRELVCGDKCSVEEERHSIMCKLLYKRSISGVH